MTASARMLWLLPVALALIGCDQKAPAPEKPDTPAQAKADNPAGRLDRSHAGSPAPAVEFLDADGETATLAEFRGKPLLVNLWATWCAPCIAEMPTLDALAAREEGKLHILALSQDMNGHDKVRAFFGERRFKKLEPYIDPELSLMTKVKVEVLPTTILYDAKGREVWRITGGEDWQSARAAALVAEASGT